MLYLYRIRLANALGEPRHVIGLLESLLKQMLATFPRASGPYQKASTMQLLLQQHHGGLGDVCDLLRLERQHQISCSGEPVARWAALFDAWVQRSEEASVAL